MGEENGNGSEKSFLKKITGLKEKLKPVKEGMKTVKEKVFIIPVKLHLKKKGKNEIAKKIELPKNAKPAMPEIKKLFEKYENISMETEFRFAVLGIGNDLKGDDGIGWYVIDKLKNILPKDNVLLMKTATPENHVKEIREFFPSILIIVDSASFGGSPGQIRKIEEHEIQRIFYSTHTTPLTIFMKLLKQDLPSTRIVVLGIQKKQTMFGIPMLSDVKKSGDKIIKMICDLHNSKTMEKGLDGAITELSSNGTPSIKKIFRK